ncbi:MAG: hypothetical protein KDH20_18025 [Rhodocyclaceae bacterium]|nr:hypothetical protein [Rhodocyclaceae bacterium]
MAEIFDLPYEFVDHLIKPGLACEHFHVPLDAYLSRTAKNGGADSATSLIGNIRSKIKDGGHGQTLQQMYGSGLDRMWRGCGDIDVIRGVWAFLCRNKEQLKTVKVTAYARRDRDEPDDKNKLYSGNVYDLYFKGRSDKAALKKMVDDRFFGLDCIGFLGNYFVWAGEWADYSGVQPRNWPEKVCKQKVERASDIKQLDILCWRGHVAIVDWIWHMASDKSVCVDICQSSSGGPQCNSRVVIEETGIRVAGRRQFKIKHRGNPAMPVHDYCSIMRRAGFFY